ncbi:MAG: exosortase/archaeosortase family protein [Paludibacteraceae bacterium]|nr:exosortase/archaeosortase family protein [Paludibacteraceae bacterium]
MKFHSLKQRFEPYQDVIIFMVTLLVANYFWKFTVQGDETGDQVTWFGLDISAPFEFMACHVAAAVYWLVSLVRDTVHMVGPKTIRFDSGVGTTIVWGCTALKQSFIWLCLMLTVRSVSPETRTKTWLHKLWYIPLGWLCCYLFNILRIALIALLIEHHPAWFNVLHAYIFKYAFYAMLFGLWVLFVEKIRCAASTR